MYFQFPGAPTCWIWTPAVGTNWNEACDQWEQVRVHSADVRTQDVGTSASLAVYAGWQRYYYTWKGPGKVIERSGSMMDVSWWMYHVGCIMVGVSWRFMLYPSWFVTWNMDEDGTLYLQCGKIVFKLDVSWCIHTSGGDHLERKRCILNAVVAALITTTIGTTATTTTATTSSTTRTTNQLTNQLTTVTHSLTH